MFPRRSADVPLPFLVDVTGGEGLCVYLSSPFGLGGVLVRVSIINLTSFQCARIMAVWNAYGGLGASKS